MNLPPFLLAAALLFWGWQTAMVLPSVIMAVVLETARGVSWRGDFSTADFRRIWGKEPPPITAIGVMQDTDDTGAMAVAELRRLEWQAP